MSDRTIFCLGGRGHDENATSDLLRFFLDPAEEHGHGMLFLDALRECVGDLAFRVDPSLRVQCERKTASGSRIDLWIESTTSVLVIENQHWSRIGNPLDDYERFARDAASGKTDGTVDLIVLGFRPDGLRAPWRFVAYRALIAALHRRLATEYLQGVDARWRVLTAEFLRHLQIESGDYDETQLAAMLAALRNEDGRLDARRLRDVSAKLVPFVSNRLAEALGEGCVRTDAWCEADRGHGWRWRDAIDFQMLDKKAADVFVSLAIRHSSVEALAGPQLCLVSWVRPQARRPDVAERCRKRLSGLGFEEICVPGVRHWESGRAYDRGLEGATLAEAIDAATAVMRGIREITEGWANPADPLPSRA
jgi:hypothetical protein